MSRFWYAQWVIPGKVMHVRRRPTERGPRLASCLRTAMREAPEEIRDADVVVYVFSGTPGISSRIEKTLTLPTNQLDD